MSSMYSLGVGVVQGVYKSRNTLRSKRENREKSLESGIGLAAKIGLAFGSVVGFVVT